MSNAARDLLNFVDEHKEEMKDNTYKGIVDRLAPINKFCNEKLRTKYHAWFLVSSFSFEMDGDDPIGNTTQRTKCVDVFLTEKEARHINKRLDDIGIICFWGNVNENDIGIQTIKSFHSILHKPFDDCKVQIDTNWNDEEECEIVTGQLMFSNKVCLTRIKKV